MGRALTQIETGFGYLIVGFDYYFLSPDWRTLYVARTTKRQLRASPKGVTNRQAV